MLSSTAIAALIDIRYNIALTGEFVAGFELNSFKTNLKTFYATTRSRDHLGSQSKAAGRFQVRHPEIAWVDMRDAGNFYRHDYDDVSPTLVWKTVRESLPPLLVAVESELAAADLAASRSKDHDT